MGKFKEFIGPPVRDKKELYVSSAISFINEHYCEDMALGETAAYVGINESSLSRLFREKTDYPFMEYVKGVRINKSTGIIEKRKS